MLRAMSEQQPPEGSPAAQNDQVPQRFATSKGPPPDRNPRRQMAVWGGILAGLGIGLALACLMHVIEQSSPNGSYGSGIGGLTALVVIVAGPAIGLGFGVIACGLIPDIPGPAAAAQASPLVDLPVTSAPPEAASSDTAAP
jgi:hypothetical protein